MKTLYSAGGGYVIVVGGNSGIGTALISSLLESDAKVISIDIQEATSIRHDAISYFKADPKDKDQLQSIVNTIAKDVDSCIGLVNLSGAIKYFGNIESASAHDWNETFNISFLSCLNSCQLFIPLLGRGKKAAIVNMSSGLAFIGQKNYGPYSAAKAAIVNLTKTLATELGSKIRVNCVAPGAVDTSFIYQEDGSTRFNLEQYQSLVPTGAIAKPEEIASVIMFLLSEGASHVNGECIHVNGGVS